LRGLAKEQASPELLGGAMGVVRRKVRHLVVH
jgi:hypothetical protein